jgi:hypothetical protein
MQRYDHSLTLSIVQRIIMATQSNGGLSTSISSSISSSSASTYWLLSPVSTDDELSVVKYAVVTIVEVLVLSRVAESRFLAATVVTTSEVLVNKLVEVVGTVDRIVVIELLGKVLCVARDAVVLNGVEETVVV